MPLTCQFPIYWFATTPPPLHHRHHTTYGPQFYTFVLLRLGYGLIQITTVMLPVLDAVDTIVIMHAFWFGCWFYDYVMTFCCTPGLFAVDHLPRLVCHYRYDAHLPVPFTVVWFGLRLRCWFVVPVVDSALRFLLVCSQPPRHYILRLITVGF